MISMIFALLAWHIPAIEAEEVSGFDKAAFMASAEAGKRIELALTDCVEMALKNNSEIQVKKISPLIEDANILIEKAAFEPDLSFAFTMEDNTEASAIGLISRSPAKTRTSEFNFGYDQKLIAGTQIELDFDNIRTRTNSPIQNINPSFDSKLELTLTQPLLKGFGTNVNKAFLSIARNNRLKSAQEVTQEIISVLTDVKTKYYDFQYTQEELEISRSALERVRNLHEINKERHAKGLASNVDLLESEAELANAEKDLLSAEASMKLAEDNLKLITNIVNDAELWNAEVRLTEDLSYAKETVGLVDAIKAAFEHRPDYEAQKIDLENKDISIVYYKNNLLPTLDLVGSYGLNGLAKTYGKDLRHVGGGNYPDWTVGVNVKLPLFNDEEKARYDISKLEKARALISFKRLEQTIILEVRAAVRNVDIKYRTLEAARAARLAQIANYSAQEQRFSAGLISTLDTITYQERLTKAEAAYARGVMDYKIALIELAKARGTTLVDDNITVE